MRIKYTKELLQEAVDNANSLAGVLRFLGLKQAGGSQTHVANKLKNFDIDTSHFLGQAHLKGTVSNKKKTAKDILIKRPNSDRRQHREQLYRALIEIGRPYLCEGCGQGPVWNGVELVLDIDHINQDWLDDRADNLRFLCPNCHSQHSRGQIKTQVEVM